VERVLAIDMSSKTGWSVQDMSKGGFSLIAWGQVKQISEPQGQYPGNYVVWAYMIFAEVISLIDTYAPDTLVIEETAGGSKNTYSQKILEFSHFLLAKFIKDSGIKSIYFMTEEWRRITGCKMTKEESKHNKIVKKFKDKNNTSIAYDENGKRIGKLTRKHINVRRANEIFGEYFKEPLRKKDEDLCDSLLLGNAYYIKFYKESL